MPPVEFTIVVLCLASDLSRQADREGGRQAGKPEMVFYIWSSVFSCF